ncbi:putative integral membrane protein [Candidatus Protofrankia datiscae]|uniref:Putative integral membrane protein n=2 Tax=Protofrankia TaxID=2994361 RepID=F8B1Q1_9ACTN|nr:putative integral membrane protein [Candidatus Protofrankia datiscae]
MSHTRVRAGRRGPVPAPRPGADGSVTGSVADSREEDLRAAEGHPSESPAAAEAHSGTREVNAGPAGVPAGSAFPGAAPRRDGPRRATGRAGRRRGGGSRRRRHRWDRPLRVLVVLVAAVCWPAVVGLLTVHATVQQPGYYKRALADADVYERFYSQVLTDPQIVEISDQLFAGLPVDQSLLTANLRVVVPPSSLQGVAASLAERTAGYLSGNGDTLYLRIDLRPVLANISQLASTYLADELSGAGTYPVDDVSRFTVGLLDALDQLSQGRPPASVPSITSVRLSERQADQVADAVLDRVGGLGTDEHQAVREQLVTFMRAGDLTSALAVAGPLVFDGDEAAIADLRRRVGGGTSIDLGPALTGLPESPGTMAVHAVHDLGSSGVLLAAGGLAGLMLVVFATGFVVIVRHGGSGFRLVLAGLVAAGAAGLAAGGVLMTLVGDPLAALTGPSSSLPVSVRAMVGDISSALVDQVRDNWFGFAAMPLVAAAGVTVVAAAARMLVVRAHARRRRWGTLAITSTTIVVLLWIAMPLPVTPAARYCNGSELLCDRRYTDVVYPATHNAMAASDARFLGAAQDPDLIGQLNAGIRALLIDVHHWTPPQDVEAFLRGLPPDQRATLEPFTRGARSSRPGLWLCHNICQLGALSLETELTRLRAWLDANPTEVVTLIVQDEAPASEVTGAFTRAGLGRYTLTPPRDADGDWPSLGSMVERNRRLVVLAENADVPGTFYRRFFRYAADTALDVSSPDGFDCRPGRGPGRPAAILINHWITRTASSRADAAVINRRESLLRQVEACQRAQGRLPTFIAVDFATIGDLVPTVAELNHLQDR